MAHDNNRPGYGYNHHHDEHRVPDGCVHKEHCNHHDVYGQARTPVQIERILESYRNPDGSPSKGKYYLYPITCFRAVRMTEDIHSATLEEVIAKWEDRLKHRQRVISSGDENTILTRGKDDGKLGELTKVDYPDVKRVSKKHMLSEHGVFKLAEMTRLDINEDIKKEMARAVTTEEGLKDEIRVEAHRALEAEGVLRDAIGQVGEACVSKSIFGDGETILQNLSYDFDNLADVKWRRSRINIQTGSKETKVGSFDMLKQIVEIVDDHIAVDETITGKIDASEFDSTDGNTVAKLDFIPGKGGVFIGAVSSIVKNIRGRVADAKHILNFRSETLRGTIEEVSSLERTLNIEVIYASDEDVSAMLRKVYA